MSDAFGPITNLITREECAKNHKTMMDKIDEVKNDISDIKILLAGLPEKIFEKADKRYAAKTVEKAVYAAIGVMCTTVLLGLLALIINK